MEEILYRKSFLSQCTLSGKKTLENLPTVVTKDSTKDLALMIQSGV